MHNQLLIGDQCFNVYKIIEKKRLNKVKKLSISFRLFSYDSSIDQYEQLSWTEIYRPRNSKTYLGNHTKQIQRLNEWFLHWTKKLHNEQPKKVSRKRRRNYDDNSDEDFIDDSSKYISLFFISIKQFEIIV
jgi:hypothetical protein